jgi:hypothetical protein
MKQALQPACQIFAVLFFARQIYRRKIVASALQAMRIRNVGMLLNPLSCQTFPTHDMMS